MRQKYEHKQNYKKKLRYNEICSNMTNINRITENLR